MARLSDFESLNRSEPAQAAEQAPLLSASLTPSNSALEGLLYPIVIVNHQGDICFMNDAARRLLAEGLDRRLAAHVSNHPQIGLITQVHFKLQNGHDLILKVRLAEIEWLGEKAMQVLISNVTPYLAMIQELQREVGIQKQALEQLVARRPETEPQPAANGETLEKLQMELEAESAARAKAQENTLSLREDLDIVTQENAQLRSDLAIVTRVREELKESRLRLQKQVEELRAASAGSQDPGAASAELEERARSCPPNWRRPARNLRWKPTSRRKPAGHGKPSAPRSSRAPPGSPRRSIRRGSKPRRKSRSGSKRRPISRRPAPPRPHPTRPSPSCARNWRRCGATWNSGAPGVKRNPRRSRSCSRRTSA